MLTTTVKKHCVIILGHSSTILFRKPLKELSISPCKFVVVKAQGAPKFFTFIVTPEISCSTTRHRGGP